MMGIGFQALEQVLFEQFKKKGDAIVSPAGRISPGAKGVEDRSNGCSAYKLK
jgi:hypothetical protein